METPKIDLPEMPKVEMPKVDLKALSDSMRKATQAMQGANEAMRRFSASLPRSTTIHALAALNLTGKHIYAGTVPGSVIEKRRKANKVARRQRRVNNLRSFRKGVR